MGLQLADLCPLFILTFVEMVLLEDALSECIKKKLEVNEKSNLC